MAAYSDRNTAPMESLWGQHVYIRPGVSVRDDSTGTVSQATKVCRVKVVGWELRDGTLWVAWRGGGNGSRPRTRSAKLEDLTAPSPLPPYRYCRNCLRKPIARPPGDMY